MTYLIGIIYILYGLYIVWVGIKTAYYPSCAWGVVSMIGGVALLLKKTWSKYIIYLFSAGVTFTIISMLFHEYKLGVLKLDGTLHTVISLIPAGCAVIICLGSSYIVHEKMKFVTDNKNNT